MIIWFRKHRKKPKEIVELVESTSQTKERGGAEKPRETAVERVFSFLFCLMVLIFPMIFIEHGYDTFTSEHGEAREGAAGAGLALAVVFRTVSRTVLRTIVRTSARAGVRASLKGAMKNVAKTVIRSQTSKVLKKGIEEKEVNLQSNFKSLLFASGLLYASWVIVIGLGQPYENLLNKEDSIAKELSQQEEEKILHLKMAGPAIESWRRKQAFLAEEHKLEDLRVKLKGSRDIVLQKELQLKVESQSISVTQANLDYNKALKISKDQETDPNEKSESEEPEASALGDAIQYLLTYAPYPGHVHFTSPIIWIGGIIMFLPLWFIFFFQNWMANRLGAKLDLQTEKIGGGIQLYFAAAFSFMPLTSDVMVDTTVEKRGWIAIAGLFPPTIVSIALWVLWKKTGLSTILFVSDAFLLFPMVQIFPLDPLEGIHLWKWNKSAWLFSFFIIMGMFLLAGSEALKNVI
jgi:hypothetical protein